MRPLLILTGLELEARALARELGLPRLRGVGVPAFGRRGVRVASVGLGARLLPSRWAALTAVDPPSLVVSAGVCAGLDPALGPGDLVIPCEVQGARGERHEVGRGEHRAAAACAPSAAHGALLTTEAVAATPAAKAALFRATGAVAADMESAPILAAAAGHPRLVVRGVSDDAGRCLPADLVALVSPDGAVRAGRAAALIARPGVLREAFALRRDTARALRNVAALLDALASSS